jgi:hypothetical protein
MIAMVSNSPDADRVAVLRMLRVFEGKNLCAIGM